MHAVIEPIAPAHDALRQALQAILRSPLFARAPRTCDLLYFLVEKKLSGREADITEHAIGLAVFRRDARSYDTALDPVVRVQMGRLRARLAAYAAAQATPGLRLTIPLGSYVPVFTEVTETAVTPDPAQPAQRPLQLAPLRNLALAFGSAAFVAGVDAELGCKLFHAFGSLVQGPAHRADARERLEGSVRIDHGHVRASMRLVDLDTGVIGWLAQVDCRGKPGIALQEELAGAICARVQDYLAMRWRLKADAEYCLLADRLRFAHA